MHSSFHKGQIILMCVSGDFVTAVVIFVCQDGGHSGGVNCVQWHPEENLLYSGSDDTYIAEWDLQTGKTRRSVFSFLP